MSTSIFMFMFHEHEHGHGHGRGQRNIHADMETQMDIDKQYYVPVHTCQEGRLYR